MEEDEREVVLIINMKYIFLLTLITLFSFDINDNKSNPYINYSLNISQAESLILNNNYSEALQHYKKAYSINVKPIANNIPTIRATKDCPLKYRFIPTSISLTISVIIPLYLGGIMSNIPFVTFS